MNPKFIGYGLYIAAIFMLIVAWINTDKDFAKISIVLVLFGALFAWEKKEKVEILNEKEE